MSATYIHTQRDAGNSRRILKFLAILYFLCLAASVFYVWSYTQNRYISTAAFKVSIDSSSGTTAGWADLILPGLTGSGASDAQLAIGFIGSADLLLETEKEFHLISHYTSPKKDFVFRLKRNANLEERLAYYRERITARTDEMTGQTIISVDTFDPRLSQAIAASLLKKAEVFANTISRDVAEKQLEFVQGQVARTSQQVEEQTQELLKLQNKYHFISPEQIISASVAALHEMRMSRLKVETELATLLRDSPNSPNIGPLRSNLRSINEVIDAETAKLSGPEADRLNQIVAEFKKVQQRLEFATQLRLGAEALLEKTRTDATSHPHYFSVIQNPYLPEGVALPSRTYASISILALGAFLFFILRALAHSMLERV